MYWRNKIRDGNPEYGRLCTCIGETKSGMGTLSMGGCVHVLEKQNQGWEPRVWEAVYTYWRNKIRDGNPEYGRLRTCIGETKSGMGTLSMGGCVHVLEKQNQGWEP